MIFHPKTGMYQGIVLRQGLGLEPDSSQTIKRSQGSVFRDVVVIIPYIATPHGRDVSY
jgi:hypothetical protein